MRRGRDLRERGRPRRGPDGGRRFSGAATVTVSARAATEGRLFGSVSAADVAEAITAQTGAEIDRHKIALAEPIKTVGTHVVPVQLHDEVDRRGHRRGRGQPPDPAVGPSGARLRQVPAVTHPLRNVRSMAVAGE